MRKAGLSFCSLCRSLAAPVPPSWTPFHRLRLHRPPRRLVGSPRDRPRATISGGAGLPVPGRNCFAAGRRRTPGRSATAHPFRERPREPRRHGSISSGDLPATPIPPRAASRRHMPIILRWAARSPSAARATWPSRSCLWRCAESRPRTAHRPASTTWRCGLRGSSGSPAWKP